MEQSVWRSLGPATVLPSEHAMWLGPADVKGVAPVQFTSTTTSLPPITGAVHLPRSFHNNVVTLSSHSTSPLVVASTANEVGVIDVSIYAQPRYTSVFRRTAEQPPIVGTKWMPAFPNCIFVVVGLRLLVFTVSTPAGLITIHSSLELSLPKQVGSRDITDFCFGTQEGWESLAVFLLDSTGRTYVICPVAVPDVQLSSHIAKACLKQLSAAEDVFSPDMKAKAVAWVEAAKDCGAATPYTAAPLTALPAVQGPLSNWPLATRLPSSDAPQKLGAFTQLATLPPAITQFANLVCVSTRGFIASLVSLAPLMPRWELGKALRSQSFVQAALERGMLTEYGKPHVFQSRPDAPVYELALTPCAAADGSSPTATSDLLNRMPAMPEWKILSVNWVMPAFEKCVKRLPRHSTHAYGLVKHSADGIVSYSDRLGAGVSSSFSFQLQVPREGDSIVLFTPDAVMELRLNWVSVLEGLADDNEENVKHLKHLLSKASPEKDRELWQATWGVTAYAYKSKQQTLGSAKWISAVSLHALHGTGEVAVVTEDGTVQHFLSNRPEIDTDWEVAGGKRGLIEVLPSEWKGAIRKLDANALMLEKDLATVWNAKASSFPVLDAPRDPKEEPMVRFLRGQKEVIQELSSLQSLKQHLQLSIDIIKENIETVVKGILQIRERIALRQSELREWKSKAEKVSDGLAKSLERVRALRDTLRFAVLSRDTTAEEFFQQYRELNANALLQQARSVENEDAPQVEESSTSAPLQERRFKALSGALSDKIWNHRMKIRSLQTEQKNFWWAESYGEAQKPSD